MYVNKHDYADDLKIFTKVDDAQDAALLQNSLDKLLAWCGVNSFFLNRSKCFVISFLKTQNPISFPYILDGEALQRKDQARDLGVLFDSRLLFPDHVGMVAGRAMRALGFLKRCTREFTNVAAITHLYLTMVRPIMEYASVVWSPYYEVHKQELERVQRKFLRYVAYRSGGLDDYHPESLRAGLGLPTLETRRLLADTMFFRKLVIGELDCPALLAQISLHAPSYPSRLSTLFYVPFSTTNYLYHRPLHRLPRQVNALLNQAPDIDIFCSPAAQIKRSILQ
ncbi:Retrotransposon protein [Nesidiocoris tenuis]|uniref:Retrotransposon protein n=1 Tax=Nesidiocoris tenuis TaxID=355587 RepID=A0ABN7APH3_9HEMI|nr:Retrotransposon protein [Nesidiocoris tenuis]